MKKKYKLHIFAIAGLLVFSALAMGKTAMPTVEPVPVGWQQEIVEIVPVPWAAYSVIPSKDYIVVGTVVLRNVNSDTLLADLMDAAAAMGGHDIKNVLLSVTTVGDETTINVATAVVISYTAETLWELDRYLGIGRTSGPAVVGRDIAPVFE